MPDGRILVIEDRASLRRLLERALTGEGYEVVTAADGPAGIERLGGGDGEGGDGDDDGAFDLVITDLKLPGASGLEVLAAARASRPRPAVIVLTGYGTVPTAVEAMRGGAFHFLEKPVALDELFRLVAAAIGGGEPDGLELGDGRRIVGRHPRLRAALKLLERVAPTDSTVLLTGESGTGKELAARALHDLSPRRDRPFVAVNCAAIPESLVENELFGHQKGAFTGADRQQAGRFEIAEGGTLFLDEIGELPPAVQSKVLRVLEERTFERVGGGRTLTADVRLVAATNRDLRAMVDDGRFRADLFFRLEVFPVELPALGERLSDLPDLVRHLLGRIAGRHGTPPPTAAPDALELLAGHPWPGNVRELGNVLERAVILAEGPTLTANDLEPLLAPLVSADERDQIRQALEATEGDPHRAAERLGTSYRTLLRKIRRYDLKGVGKYR